MREPIREDSFNMVKEEKSMQKHKSFTKWMLLACTVGAFLLVLILIVMNGYYVEEGRDYGKVFTLSEEQFRQIADGDDYWQSMDRSEAEVAKRLSKRVGKLMKFTFRNDLQNMQGNCEGQAMVCSAVINHAFKERGFLDCHAKPVIVQVYFYNINMNRLLCAIVPSKYKYFIVNHCVVKVHYSSGEEEYLDPSICDGAFSIQKKGK